MRIRKNCKIHPHVYPTSSPNAGALIQTHVCLLNQSPWNLINFSPPESPPPPKPPPPPPPSQVCKNDVCLNTGCMPDNNIRVLDSKNNGESGDCPRKACRSVVEALRPVRARKNRETTSTSNPYQFYYYSGFGPNWRKEKGESNKNTGNVSQNVDELNPSLLSQFDEDSSTEDEYKNGKKRKKRRRR